MTSLNSRDAPDYRRFSAEDTCILPMTCEVQTSDYSSFTTVTGFRCVTVREMLCQARHTNTYVEVVLDSFGINVHDDAAAKCREEIALLDESASRSPILAAASDRLALAAPAREPVFSKIFHCLWRLNRSDNKECVIYYAFSDTLVVHLRTYQGLGGRAAIGMECLRRLSSIDGVRTVTVVGSTAPYLEVEYFNNNNNTLLILAV